MELPKIFDHPYELGILARRANFRAPYVSLKGYPEIQSKISQVVEKMPARYSVGICDSSGNKGRRWRLSEEAVGRFAGLGLSGGWADVREVDKGLAGELDFWLGVLAVNNARGKFLDPVRLGASFGVCLQFMEFMRGIHPAFRANPIRGEGGHYALIQGKSWGHLLACVHAKEKEVCGGAG